MSCAPGRRVGPYEILTPLGAGGMGEVWRARDTRLGRDVAIKVLPAVFAQDAERMARFEREAQMLAALNHPNVAAIYGLEESGGQRFLVLELVPGETLAERLGPGPLPIDEALAICRQIAEALEEAHEKGIVHRDLKPANVKITPDGKVKVLDFGLAKALSDDPAGQTASHSPTLTAAALTRGGVLLGTAAYMSPEQARGRSIDKRSDVWAFGCVLFELLTARQTFGGETISDTLAAILKNDPDWTALPESTPPRIRALLRRCLEKDAKRRLRDIGEARIIIDSAEGPALESPRPSVPASPRRPVPWIAAAAVFALAAAALAFVHFREKPPEAPATRFELTFPGSLNPQLAPVISPDGRRVAFAATGQDGRQLLWVRPLDSLAARPLSGTESAAYPFWSPDSRFIAFSSGGKLKKIEAAGGPPQTLGDVPSWAIGGSWNRDGVILFGNLGGGLLRVSSAGGVPAPLTTLDSSRKETWHFWPHFLPDDRHFLYLAMSSQTENSAIYVASLDSPNDRKRLVSASHGAAYAPPQHDREPSGHLLFLRDGTLMAQPFDEKRLQVAGEAFPVAEQIGSFLSTGFFSVSGNGVLAYRTGADRSTQLAWFDRAGKQLAKVGPPGDYNDLALSPDEKRVAASRRDGSNVDIWLIDLERDNSSRFTFHEAMDWLSVWSPDGGRIAFSSVRDGAASLYQKVSSGAGSDELLLKSPGNPLYAHDWSPDGRYLLYSNADPKTKSDLWVLPLGPPSGPERKPMPFLQTEFSEYLGQFSPDGKLIAYTSEESGRSEVYVQPFPPSGAKWMISSGGGAQPRWKRDGKEIFYIASNRKLMAVEVKIAPAFQAAVPQALFETRITGGGPYAFRYAASANGQRFLINVTPEETASAPIVVVQNWTSGVKR